MVSWWVSPRKKADYSQTVLPYWTEKFKEKDEMNQTHSLAFIQARHVLPQPRERLKLVRIDEDKHQHRVNNHWHPKVFQNPSPPFIVYLKIRHCRCWKKLKAKTLTKNLTTLYWQTTMKNTTPPSWPEVNNAYPTAATVPCATLFTPDAHELKYRLLCKNICRDMATDKGQG